MEYFGLVDKLRDYCTDHNWVFIYGDSDMVNAVIDKNKTYPDQKYLTASFNVTPTIEGSKIQSMTYSGIMALGQKKESLTQSNLDETLIQKYDIRLKELSQLLTMAIAQISCDNEMEVSGMNLKFEVNKYDLAIDFVACSVNFIQ